MVLEADEIHQTYQKASKWEDDHIKEVSPADLSELYGFKMQYEYYGEFNEIYKCFPCFNPHERAKYKAWKHVTDLTQEEALQQYIYKYYDVLKKNSESKIMTKAEKKILKKCKKFDECVEGSTS